MDLSLYLITDSNGLSENEFYSRIEAALKAGVTMVQLREKELKDRDLYMRALKLKEICHRYNVPLIMNDFAGLVLAANLDGVHLGANDLPISKARELLGEGKIIGATAKTVEAAQAAEKDGADYFGIGAFFATDTKTDALVLTPAQIKEVTSSVSIPAVGIGGLDAENIDIIEGCNLKGVALSNAIMRSDDIEKTVKELKEKILRYRG
ncbi:MAG: thiamine phosphate synthase [Clostridia bacterium]|nr:thiamine phosphate synthase [Clostridia bacterium]